jgi:hypothetical protein
MTEKLILPAVADGEDRSRADELINVTATDSQSFLAVLHNTIYFDPATRPPKADASVRAAHWLLAGLFTLLTLRAGRGGRAEGGPGLTLFIGALALVMILCSPVCHTHYFALGVPLVMGLLARVWEDAPYGLPPASYGLGGGLLALFALQVVGHTLPQVPQLQVTRDNGLALYTTLALWWVGCRALRDQGARAAMSASVPSRRVA